MNDMMIYDGIHPTLQGELKDKAREVVGLIKKTSGDLYRIGEILSEVKGTLDSRKFIGWCEQEIGVKKSTAYSYLSIFDRFSEKKEIVNNIEPWALITLSSKSTPQYVVDEAVQKAESGETVTQKETKKIIQEGKKREKELDVPPPPEPPKDRLGSAIPAGIERRFQLDEHLDSIKMLTAKIQEHAMLLRQSGLVKMDYDKVIDRAKSIWSECDKFHPVFVCRSCRGEGCGKCDHQGWIRSTSG